MATLNILRQTLLESQCAQHITRAKPQLLHSLNEHFEHDGYRYWTYIDRSTDTRLYKKRNIVTGAVERITLDEYTNAACSDAKKRPSASKGQKPVTNTPSKKPPKPTKAELAQFTEDWGVNLTTKSGKEFFVDVGGNIETWESFFNEFPVSPSHIIKETLGSFVDAVSPDTIHVRARDFGEYLFFNVHSEKSKKGNPYSDDYEPKQVLDRRFYFNRKDKSLFVSHELFFVNEDKQGKGLSKKIMSEALDLYESIGVSTVELDAAGTVGKYAWAKYGFVPKSKAECHNASDYLQAALERHSDQFQPDTEIYSELSEHIEKLRDDPAAIRRIADYAKPLLDKDGNPLTVIPFRDGGYFDIAKDGKPMNAGKALMLLDNFRWEGKVSLSDKFTVDLWRQYTNKGHKAKQESHHMTEQTATPPSNPLSPSDIFSMYAAKKITDEQADKLFREAAAGPGPFSIYDVTLLATDGYITPERASDLYEKAGYGEEDPIDDTILELYGPDYKGTICLEGDFEKYAQIKREMEEGY